MYIDHHVILPQEARLGQHVGISIVFGTEMVIGALAPIA